MSWSLEGSNPRAALSQGAHSFYPPSDWKLGLPVSRTVHTIVQIPGDGFSFSDHTGRDPSTSVR